MTDRRTDLSALDIDGVLARLEEARSVLLTTHVNPDGDALGSELGLMHMLRAMGREVAVRNTSPAPPNLQFLDPADDLVVYDAARDAALLDAVDLIVVLDVNASSRLRTMEEAVCRRGDRTIVVDHHLDPEPFASGYWTDLGAAATAQMVARLVERSEVALTRPMAEALYVGLMTDTGSFRFERTTPEVHEIAARLLAAGVDPTLIHQRIFDNFPLRRTLLVGRILAGIEVHCVGRVTVLTVPRALYVETGTTHTDLEDTVNLGLAIEGVQATALLSETDDAIRVSFRSRGAVHVNGVARQFGGGGHAYAAGATLTGMALDEARTAVASALCAAAGQGGR